MLVHRDGIYCWLPPWLRTWAVLVSPPVTSYKVRPIACMRLHIIIDQ